MKADVLVAGRPGRGPLLKLRQPISFWGGVDPFTGAIIDARHPDRGANIAGRVLALPGMIGSSSASAVMLELIRGGHAPAALLMAEVDAILLVGFLVAREMGWPTPIAARLGAGAFASLAPGCYAVGADGAIARTGDGDA